MTQRDEILMLGKRAALDMEKHERPLTGELRRALEAFARFSAASPVSPQPNRPDYNDSDTGEDL